MTEAVQRAQATRMLLALNAFSREGRKHVYMGTVSPQTKGKRRSLNERQRASRKANR